MLPILPKDGQNIGVEKSLLFSMVYDTKTASPISPLLVTRLRINTHNILYQKDIWEIWEIGVEVVASIYIIIHRQ